MQEKNLIYCHRVLPRVSRTFALGIELLNSPLRDTVCIAYLICRVLDTIEDTTSLPAEERAALLGRARRELPDPERWENCCRIIRSIFSGKDFKSPDHDLCRHSAGVLEVFHDFPDPVRKAVTGPVREMADGMAKTVRRELTEGGLRMETIEDLKQYCYYVAGTVGIMLTNLFSQDRDSIAGEVQTTLHRYGVDFGLGLQLTNIIKGVTDDISRGVSYLPRQMLEQAGVTIQDLLDNPGDLRGRRLVEELAAIALPWLDNALEYTVSIPPEEGDIRLFCALPLIFAVRTLGLAVHTSRVFEEQPLKITREEVSAIYLQLKSISGQDAALREIYEGEKIKVTNQFKTKNKLE